MGRWRPNVLPLLDAQKEVRARGSGPGRRLRPPARPPRHGPFVSALNTCHPGQASKISKGFILLNTMLPFLSCKFLLPKFCSNFFCKVIIAVSLFRFSYCGYCGVQCSKCHMRQNSDGPRPFGSHLSIRIHAFHHSDERPWPSVARTRRFARGPQAARRGYTSTSSPSPGTPISMSRRSAGAAHRDRPTGIVSGGFRIVSFKLAQDAPIPF